MILRATLAFLASLVLTLGAHADITSVRLLSGVRVDPDAPVTIADVAEVKGPQHDLIAPIELLPAPGREGDPLARTTVTIDDVAKALDNVGSLNRGRLRLGGSACLIGLRPDPAPVEPIAVAPVKQVPTGPTLRTRIAEHVHALFADHATDVRTDFRDEDQTVLNTPVEGMTLEIRTLGISERLPLAISLYEGDRVVLNTSVRVRVELERPVAVLLQDIPRGRAITDDLYRVEPRWVAPNDLPPAPADILGRVARSRLSAGEVVTEHDVTAPTVIERGDLVSVRWVAGSAVVRSTARALEDGAPGDLIRMETIDRRTKFQARVAGPGQAVIASNTPQGAQASADAPSPITQPTQSQIQIRGYDS